MKKVLFIFLSVVMLASITACKKQNEAGKTKLLLWVASAMVSEPEQKLPREEWVLSRLVKEFMDQNPGVDVEIALFVDQIAMTQMFKAASSGDGSPDIVNVWAGQQLFELKDILLDIKDMIPADDKDKILGWDIMSVDFKLGNPILGYPASGNEVCGFFYNRQVLKACGLDYDKNLPRNVAEFMRDMETIKQAGFLPLAAGHGDWGEAFFTAFASWWVQSSGSERVASDSLGITKFTDDEGFLKSIQTPADMYAKGYINADYMTIPSSLEKFLDGRTAFLATGNWNTGDAVENLGEANVGFMCPPDIDGNVRVKNTCIGGPGQVMAISKACKNQDIAIKFLSFISNKKNMAEIIKTQSKLSLRKDIEPAELGIASTGIMFQEHLASLNYVFWADNTMVPDVCSELQALSALAVSNKMTTIELAEALDKKAAETARQ
jgi:ABC-type glycerol-3-phosphate transport system substrate-binding protein